MPIDIPPYDRRLFPFSRLDEEAVVAANEAQLAAREIALRTPLQSGLQFTLTLEIPAQNAAPNARKLPGIPGSDSVTVRLCEELQQGIDGFSQVWTAVCVEISATQLVLKIIQPSICRGIPWDHRDEYFDPWDLAHNEAWVYQHLPHIQGTLIPYFLGFSTIVTPCGEEAWVLLLEYIPGPTGSKINDSTPVSDIREFCALGASAVKEYILGGWSLREIRPPNFILTGDPGSRTVVIIDLVLSKPLIVADLTKYATYQMQSFFYAFAFRATDFDPELLTWAKENSLIF
ncbi:hypothetical protein R3P38DRAFT_3244693 [Favolaschia claudopus]|uniref:Protein kinase domain-containing protein n=1 Tax=Favolaschia claudopus TaxID=2862362 RepID=A0AAV9Z1R7_9AGAR